MMAWASFYPYLLLHVRGASEPLMDQELQSASAEFFQRTRVWQQWLTPGVTVLNTRTYALGLPALTDVVRLEKARVNGVAVPVESYRNMDLDIANDVLPGPGLTTVDRRQFTLLDLPAAAGLTIQIEASLKPAQDATGIPDEFFIQYRDAIVQGAKSRLMLLPDEKFTDPDRAMLAKGLFDAAIADVNSDAWRGHTGTVPRRRVNWC